MNDHIKLIENKSYVQWFSKDNTTGKSDVLNAVSAIASNTSYGEISKNESEDVNVLFRFAFVFLEKKKNTRFLFNIG